MNTASKFETALKNTIAEYAESVPQLWLRTSYDNADVRNMTAAELFPQIQVQVSNPYMETEGTTWCVDFQIFCATYFEDDIQAHTVSDISGEVEKVIYGLVNHRNETVVQYLVSALADADLSICFGGLTLSNGGYLTITDGALVNTISGTIHYTLTTVN